MRKKMKKRSEKPWKNAQFFAYSSKTIEYFLNLFFASYRTFQTTHKKHNFFFLKNFGGGQNFKKPFFFNFWVSQKWGKELFDQNFFYVL